MLSQRAPCCRDRCPDCDMSALLSINRIAMSAQELPGAPGARLELNTLPLEPDSLGTFARISFSLAQQLLSVPLGFLRRVKARLSALSSNLRIALSFNLGCPQLVPTSFVLLPQEDVARFSHRVTRRQHLQTQQWSQSEGQEHQPEMARHRELLVKRSRLADERLESLEYCQVSQHRMRAVPRAEAPAFAPVALGKNTRKSTRRTQEEYGKSTRKQEENNEKTKITRRTP